MLHAALSRVCDGDEGRAARHFFGRHLARVTRFSASAFLFVCLVQAGCPVARADESDKPDSSQGSRRRLAFMQSEIDDLDVSSSEIQNKAALKLGRTPLLRYNDPTRGLDEQKAGLVDAGVWRLGESGRPTAIVTLEIYRAPGSQTRLSYEFVSLIPAPLTIASPRGPSWNPAGTELKMALLPDAPRPADSQKVRLAQMRQMSRRFAVRETLAKGEKVECRLLTQPIDRYADEKAGITDGAMFVYANGTNPELGLLLECSAVGWSCGIFRLSAAALLADLDGQQFFDAPQRFNQPRSAPYRGTDLPISLDE